jgi:hypothetical protein
MYQHSRVNIHDPYQPFKKLKTLGNFLLCYSKKLNLLNTNRFSLWSSSIFGPPFAKL